MSHSIGIIGGSGLYDLDGLVDQRTLECATPYGPTSGPIVSGSLGGVDLFFLPRHGPGHRWLPAEVPYRANVHALRALGCGWLISVSAVGSLAEHLAPGHVVLVDQYIDRTRGRASTFFGDGVIAHASMADPTCSVLRAALLDACQTLGLTSHDGGTYLCIDGPQFSTRAESNLYRAWGADVIGMTAMPEAKLAREASMSYATLGFVTDFDCWHPEHDAVTVEQVIDVLMRNVANGKRVIEAVVPRLAARTDPPPCAGALASALLTPESALTDAQRERLEPLLAAIDAEG